MRILTIGKQIRVQKSALGAISPLKDFFSTLNINQTAKVDRKFAVCIPKSIATDSQKSLKISHGFVINFLLIYLMRKCNMIF